MKSNVKIFNKIEGLHSFCYSAIEIAQDSQVKMNNITLKILKMLIFYL